MIEIVAVLVLLLIVSYVVFVGRYSTTGTNELIPETDSLKASIRFVQILSLNDDTATWAISFPDDTSYRIYKNGADSPIVIPVKLLDPNKDPDVVACPKNCHKLQGSVKVISIEFIPTHQPVMGWTIYFDNRGRPVDASNNLIQDDINITLQQNDGQSSNTRIEKNTGFIQ